MHAPALGLTHRLLGRFHVTGVFWYQFAHSAFTTLPSWTDWPIVQFFSIFFFITLGRIRGALASNLEPVLGPAGRWERLRRSRRTIWTFAWCFTERFRRLAEPGTFKSVVEGEGYWRQLMASPQGAVVVTAHIGPWENAAQLGAAESRRRIHVVRETEIDPRAQAFVREILKRSGENYVTHFGGDDPALAFTLADALRAGEIVALQADRPRAGGRNVIVSLFGRPIPLPIGPAALARTVGVPIVPIFNFREGRFLMRTVIRPPIEVAHTADRSADIAAAVHRLALEIEWAIRERPYQWFCFRKLWD
ncbi:MAG: lysophospholipid acyltransferase family protein [Vicinamibacterales bacterium]